MRLDINVHGIKIIPETSQDEVYIYEALGLKKHGDQVRLTRIDDPAPSMHGLHAKYNKVVELHTLDRTPIGNKSNDESEG